MGTLVPFYAKVPYPPHHLAITYSDISSGNRAFPCSRRGHVHVKGLSLSAHEVLLFRKLNPGPPESEFAL